MKSLEDRVITPENWKHLADWASRGTDLTPSARGFLNIMLGAPATLAARDTDFLAKLFRARLLAEIQARSADIIDLSKENFPDDAA